ncbi:MAG: helix-turn-helix transcriptional regulator [Deltaproteobacteria bacterium]|nr:helix-turn-helix transcriptional regulator [Deltaproteobacteria bacterium]
MPNTRAFEGTCPHQMHLAAELAGRRGARPPSPPPPSTPAAPPAPEDADSVDASGDDSDEVTFRPQDLPLPYRNYAGISTAWREIAATVKLLFRLKGFRIANFEALGDFWDIFNQAVRVRCSVPREAPTFDIDALSFHEEVAGDFFSERDPEFIRAVARVHHKMRRFYAAPGERVPTTEVVFNFPALEREARVFLRTSPVLDPAITVDELLRAVMLLDEALQAKQAIDPHHVNSFALQQLAADLFPREQPAFRAAVQCIRAKYQYRHAHGSFAGLLIPVRQALQGRPNPGLYYLNHILDQLGLSREVLVTTLGIPLSQIATNLAHPRRYFPFSSLARLLNLLELPDVSGLVYCCYRPFLDRYCAPQIAAARVQLHAANHCRPTEQLRRFGIGGLARAHRIVRGLRLTDVLGHTAFPIHKDKTLIHLEHNRGKPLTLETAFDLIDFYGMGVEGLFALMPDLPRLIPTHQPTGVLVEPLASWPFALPGYAPEVYVTGGAKEKGVSAYNEPRTSGTLSHRLLFERTLRGWSRAELAKKTGLAETTIYYLERDARPPEDDTLAILAHPRIFNIPIDELRALAHASQ